MAQQNGLPSDFSMEKAMAFINSPAGRQLAQLLQQSNDPKLGKAAAQAASGNADLAKETVSSLLHNPEIRELLKQFGG